MFSLQYHSHAISVATLFDFIESALLFLFAFVYIRNIFALQIFRYFHIRYYAALIELAFISGIPS